MLNALVRLALEHWIFLLIVAVAIAARKSLRLPATRPALLARLEDDRIACGLVMATSLCVCVASGYLHGMPWPRYHDDYGYLLDADTFLHGRISNPTHPLWPHFETMHVLQVPRYISKYPIGQGLIFAVGIKFFGHPMYAAWIVTVAACAAVWWALRVWTTPSLALLGGIATAVHPTMVEWIESYHGGQLAVLAGALMLAAAGRLREKPSWQMSAIVGLGAGLLTISRPYEGLIFCIGIGLLLMKRPILRVAWAGGIVLAIALAFNAWRDYAIAGNPLLLPYSLYERQYDPVPNFIWEKARAVPHYRNPELADIYVNWYLAYYNRVHAPGGMLRLVGAKIKDISNAVVGPANIPNPRPLFLLLALAIVPAVAADRNTRLLAILLAVFAFAPFSIVWWMQDHYLSPATAAAACLMMLLVRRLFVTSPILAMMIVVLFFANAGLLWFGAETPDASYETRRQRVVRTLVAQGGRHLVIVAPEMIETVFNGADLNGAPVVWARDLGAASDARLIDYYKDRTVWLLTRVQLRRY